MYRNIHAAVDRLMALQHAHILALGTCGYATLHGQRELRWN